MTDAIALIDAHKDILAVACMFAFATVFSWVVTR